MAKRVSHEHKSPLTIDLSQAFEGRPVSIPFTAHDEYFAYFSNPIYKNCHGDSQQLAVLGVLSEAKTDSRGNSDLGKPIVADFGTQPALQHMVRPAGDTARGSAVQLSSPQVTDSPQVADTPAATAAVTVTKRSTKAVTSGKPPKAVTQSLLYDIMSRPRGLRYIAGLAPIAAGASAYDDDPKRVHNRKLPPLVKAILEVNTMYNTGYTQRAIARALGIKEPALSNMKNHVEAKNSTYAKALSALRREGKVPSSTSA